MKIVSDFSDCYDYHETTTNDTYNSALYLRQNKINPDIVKFDLIDEFRNSININTFPKIFYKNKIIKYNLGWLFMAGYIFPILSTDEDKLNIDFYKIINNKGTHLNNLNILHNYCAVPYDDLINLSILVQMPVFCILSCDEDNYKINEYLIVKNKVPILKHTGILQYFETVKIYSLIDFYVSSVLNNGDKDPPVIVSDEIKRDKHGFDTNSFKHRPK